LRQGLWLGLLLLLGIAIGTLYPWLQSRFDSPSDIVELSGDPACDPAVKPCTARTSALTLTLQLMGEVRPLTPFTVRVELAGTAAATIEQARARFTMVGMNMGRNRFKLDFQADGVWQGQAMLPLCSTGRRDWQVSAEAVGATLYRADFATVVGR